MPANDLAALDNGLELTWLGHANATWLMKAPGGQRFLFDPWLGNPRCAAKAAELLGAGYIVPQHYGTFRLLTVAQEAPREQLGDGHEFLTVEPGGVIR